MVVPSTALIVQLRWWFYIFYVLTALLYDWIYKQFLSHKVLGRWGLAVLAVNECLYNRVTCLLNSNFL
jgi:hypothetical protein